MKRKATGIWNCGKCKKTQTGGAYILRCVGDSLGSLQSTSWKTLPHDRLPLSLTSYNTHFTLLFFFFYSTAAAATVRSNLARMRKDE